MEKYKEFRENGYVILKGIFSEEEISNIREVANEIFKDKKNENSKTSASRSIYSKTFVKNPNLINHLFKENLYNKISEVLGHDFITLLQFSMTCNIHDPTWHTDSQSQGTVEYIFDPDYNVAKCGLYLQKDDPIFGGQLEIKPKSHKPSFFGYRSYIGRDKMYGKISKIQSFFYNLKNKFIKNTRINLELGDVLLFHSHLWHRASQPDWRKVNAIHTHGIKNPPYEKVKYMIQWEVLQNNIFSNVYATHQELRANKSDNKLFTESNSISKSELDKTTQNLIKKNNFNLLTYKDLALTNITNNLRSKHNTPIVFLYK